MRIVCFIFLFFSSISFAGNYENSFKIGKMPSHIFSIKVCSQLNHKQLCNLRSTSKCIKTHIDLYWKNQGKINPKLKKNREQIIFLLLHFNELNLSENEFSHDELCTILNQLKERILEEKINFFQALQRLPTHGVYSLNQNFLEELNQDFDDDLSESEHSHLELENNVHDSKKNIKINLSLNNFSDEDLKTIQIFSKKYRVQIIVTSNEKMTPKRIVEEFKKLVPIHRISSDSIVFLRGSGEFFLPSSKEIASE